MRVNSLGALIFIVVVVAVLLGGLLLLGLWWGFGGMMGPGMMGPGMRGGVGAFWPLLLCLPVLLLILVLGGVAGAVWLAASGGKNKPVQPEVNCPSCGRAVQRDWQVCPYCSQPLQGE